MTVLMDKNDKVWSVSASDEKGDFRLGPYFSVQSARNQASRARGKGATVHSIDVADVVWQEDPDA